MNVGVNISVQCRVCKWREMRNVIVINDFTFTFFYFRLTFFHFPCFEPENVFVILVASKQAPREHGKKTGEQSESTSAKRKNSESEAIGEVASFGKWYIIIENCIPITSLKVTQFNNLGSWLLLIIPQSNRRCSTYFFFCFVDVGATLREAWTSLGGTGILTEFTLEAGESNGIPRELLAGRPFKLPGVDDKVPNELPVDNKAKKSGWNSIHFTTAWVIIARSSV